jgi:protein-tyrosine phosphatase
MDGALPFSILAVCTGNVCRSPAVERLLRQRLGPSLTVESAGTSGLVGEPIAVPMAELLVGSGVDIDGFAARRLSLVLIQQADLVLAVTRAHRRLIVEAWPKAVRRTFTLREFARLLSGIDQAALPDGSPADRLRAAVPLAAAERGRWRVPSSEDDVLDPYRQPRPVHEASLAQILPAIEAIAQVAIGAAGAVRLTSAEPRGSQASSIASGDGSD